MRNVLLNANTLYTLSVSINSIFIHCFCFYFCLFKAIRRLSKNDVKLTEDICDAMNKIVTKGEIVEKMTVELQIIKEEVIKWKYIPLTGRLIYYSAKFFKNDYFREFFPFNLFL